MAKIKIRKRKQVGEWTDQAKVAAMTIDPDIDFDQVTHHDFCKQRADLVIAELAERMKWVPRTILPCEIEPIKLLESSPHSSDETETETTK